MAISQTVPPTMQTSHHPLLIPHRPPVSSQYNLARLEMIIEIDHRLTEAEAVILREVVVTRAATLMTDITDTRETEVTETDLPDEIEATDVFTTIHL